MTKRIHPLQEIVYLKTPKGHRWKHWSQVMEGDGEGEITPGGIITHEKQGTPHLIINTKEQAQADTLPGSLSIFQLLFCFQVIGWAVISKNLNAKVLFDHQTCYYHGSAGHFHLPGGSFHLLSATFKLWPFLFNIPSIKEEYYTTFIKFWIMYLMIILIKRKKLSLLRYII